MSAREAAPRPTLDQEEQVVDAGTIENPWLARRVLNIAHQGGEAEAPSNTMFAFREALRKGADVLELDVHLTGDGHLVVIHDESVDRTTDGSGELEKLTLEQVRRFDAAHRFVPGQGTIQDRRTQDYAYRGVALGLTEPPAGYTAEDFKIPTLREVLRTFAATFINIEIKRGGDGAFAGERAVAELLGEFGRTDDVIVVSFSAEAIERFHSFAPGVSTAMAASHAAAFWASAQGESPGMADPRFQALQVPVSYQGLVVVTPPFVRKAHANGLALHVWTVDDADTMEELIDAGVDGIMTSRPTLLEQVLQARGLR